MNVISVTLFVSLLLALLFVAVFYLESKARASGRRGGVEHESLLPLEDGEPVPPPSSAETEPDKAIKHS